MLDAEAVAPSDPLLGLYIQFLERRVFDEITALELTHQKLRIGVDIDVRVVQSLSPLEAQEQGAVLRYIIGRLTDSPMKPFHNISVRPYDDDTDTGRARIAAGGAIDMDSNLFLRRGRLSSRERR